MPPKEAEEGVSRWQQRKAAKAMMYATSNEASGGGVASRRAKMLGAASGYTPQVDAGWNGRAWGLASTKVGGRQAAASTRFSGGGRGELYYGQKRQFANNDLPPEDPVSMLARGQPRKPKLTEEMVAKAKAIRELEAQRKLKPKRKRSSSSSSSSSSYSSYSSSSGSDSGSESDSGSSGSSGSSSGSRSGSRSGSSSSSRSSSSSSSRSSSSSSSSSYSSSSSTSSRPTKKKQVDGKAPGRGVKEGKGNLVERADEETEETESGRSKTPKDVERRADEETRAPEAQGEHGEAVGGTSAQKKRKEDVQKGKGNRTDDSRSEKSKRKRSSSGSRSRSSSSSSSSASGSGSGSGSSGSKA